MDKRVERQDRIKLKCLTSETCENHICIRENYEQFSVRHGGIIVFKNNNNFKYFIKVQYSIYDNI